MKMEIKKNKWKAKIGEEVFGFKKSIKHKNKSIRQPISLKTKEEKQSETNEFLEDSEMEESTDTLLLNESKYSKLESSPYVAEDFPNLDYKSLKRNNEEENERTIFLGNVDVNCKKRELLHLFSNYGKVETIRLRSFAPSQPEVSKREAAIRNNIHASRTTCNAYIRYETKEMMEAALEANGEVLHKKHLRVDRAVRKNNYDRKAAVFVGNLPFECEDEDLYKHFEQCGEIEGVRIVRNNKFLSGKGFGYVNFKSFDAVEVALQLNGKLFKNRDLRIQRCVKRTRDTKEKNNIVPKEGQKIGFMKLKGERMSLKFMKNQKKNSTKHNVMGKRNEKKKVGKKAQEADYSGLKIMETNDFKKVQKKKIRLNKADRQKLSVAHYLVGNKTMKKKRKN